MPSGSAGLGVLAAGQAGLAPGAEWSAHRATPAWHPGWLQSVDSRQGQAWPLRPWDLPHRALSPATMMPSTTSPSADASSVRLPGLGLSVSKIVS